MTVNDCDRAQTLITYWAIMSERGRSSLYIIVTRFIESLRPKNVTQKGKYINRDYLGNHYYEIEADPSRGKRKPVRWFKPPNEDLWDRPLPPEWNAWLRMRRIEPPSDEEIDMNLAIEAHKKRVDIEAKDGKYIESKHPFTDFPVHKEYEEIPGKPPKKP